MNYVKKLTIKEKEDKVLLLFEDDLKNKAIEIGNEYNHFDEFTLGICPAPTYIELLK